MFFICRYSIEKCEEVEKLTICEIEDALGKTVENYKENTMPFTVKGIEMSEYEKLLDDVRGYKNNEIKLNKRGQF